MIIAIVLFRVLVVVPSVGVIIIDSDIMTDKVKDDILDMLRYVGKENNIKGVVLSINSPGGEVSRIEEIYLEILKLRNIGVVSVLPEPVRIDRERVTTGPFKTTGRSPEILCGRG